MLKRINRLLRGRGQPPAEQIVADVYRDLLHREANAVDLAHWCRHLNAGASRKELIGYIKKSPEYQLKNPPVSQSEVNWVLPQLWEQPFSQQMRILSRLGPEVKQMAVLGTAVQLQSLHPALQGTGKTYEAVTWVWDPDVDLNAAADVILVCAIPVTAHQWQVIRRLKERYGPRLVGIQELALPFAVIAKATSCLPYAQPLDSLMSYLLAEEYLGGIDKLSAIVPLAGKSVIEFGPLDGAQTAGLLKAGARVTCVEARPENVIKTALAAQVLGWDGVRLVLDDFHNADAVKYGTFDLAFAHGVYYHSVAPFVFLENLVSLAPNIYVGGYCATEQRPRYPFDTLEHAGATYRVKAYQEMVSHPECSFTAGVNDTGYFFHGDDLMHFFRRRGFEVTVLDDEETAESQVAARYLRFLARKQS
jgi:hypothetical protein